MAKKRGNNEGSIYKDKDGRWRASVDYGYKNGKRDRKMLSGRTRAEVAAKLTNELKNRQENKPAADDRITLTRYLMHWLTAVAQPTVRPKTFRTYKDLMEDHVIPVLGAKRLTKLTPQHIRDFMKLKSEAGLSATTVKHIRNTLRAALNVAVKDGILSRNVAAVVEPPRKQQKTELRVFTPGEARIFLQLVQGDRLEALFSVALCLGLREGEILGLRWQDLDWSGCTLTVQYQLQRIDRKLTLVDVKTEKGRRSIPLPQIAVSALHAHRQRQEQERQIAGDRWRETGMIFTTTIGTKLDARNLLRSYYRLRRKSDLPKLRFHDLRHSAATLLLVQGVWSDIRTVLNTYSHVIPAIKTDAAAKMDAILTPVASNLASSSDANIVN